ncbi:MAG TPA: acyl-CoA dehydrogenase, partial [Afipia sp.]|nr:acyl-CoA dehydrogenase [Afipia sp.]
PQEAAFRAEARAWIQANAPKELEAELSQPTVGRIKLKNRDILEESKKWQKKKA